VAASVLQHHHSRGAHFGSFQSAWENSYNSPAGPDDPVEDHQYLFYSMAMEDKPGDTGEPSFKITDLESMIGPTSAVNRTAHAMILNEYGWLWLNRDGTPTCLRKSSIPGCWAIRTPRRTAWQCRHICWAARRSSGGRTGAMQECCTCLFDCQRSQGIHIGPFPRFTKARVAAGFC